MVFNLLDIFKLPDNLKPMETPKINIIKRWSISIDAIKQLFTNRRKR